MSLDDHIRLPEKLNDLLYFAQQPMAVGWDVRTAHPKSDARKPEDQLVRFFDDFGFLGFKTLPDGFEQGVIAVFGRQSLFVLPDLLVRALQFGQTLAEFFDQHTFFVSRPACQGPFGLQRVHAGKDGAQLLFEREIAAIRGL